MIEFNKNIIPFAGIILAGGNSTRMGENKYDLVINGQSMLERTISVLDPLVSQIIVVMKPSEKENQRIFSNPKVELTYDSISNRGPLQGIADGIKLIGNEMEHVFLLTCDLPYISVEWMTVLRDQYLDNTVDAVITKAENYTNPLVAVYAINVLKHAEALIQSGKKRPIDLWEGKRIKSLEIEEENERIVSDMNTPESYQEALNFYSEGKKKE